MSEEIKLNHASVESAFSSLSSVAQEFEASFSEGVEGDNILEMAEHLSELKQAFNKISSSYQSLLIQNTESAKQAVAAIKETDEAIGSK